MFKKDASKLFIKFVSEIFTKYAPEMFTKYASEMLTKYAPDMLTKCISDMFSIEAIDIMMFAGSGTKGAKNQRPSTRHATSPSELRNGPAVVCVY